MNIARHYSTIAETEPLRLLSAINCSFKKLPMDMYLLRFLEQLGVMESPPACRAWGERRGDWKLLIPSSNMWSSVQVEEKEIHVNESGCVKSRHRPGLSYRRMDVPGVWEFADRDGLRAGRAHVITIRVRLPDIRPSVPKQNGNRYGYEIAE